MAKKDWGKKEKRRKKEKKEREEREEREEEREERKRSLKNPNSIHSSSPFVMQLWTGERNEKGMRKEWERKKERKKERKSSSIGSTRENNYFVTVYINNNKKKFIKMNSNI